MLRPGIANLAYGRPGIAISLLGDLNATLYSGELYDNNTGVIVPHDQAEVEAIWAYCTSTEFPEAVRRIDRKMNVTNATLLKVPFDLRHWQKVAELTGPLPEPYSNDPTQWLFKGSPADSTDPLQVVAVRLLGYSWPQQDHDRLSTLADQDGILPLVPLAGEEPAAERLRTLLAAAYGDSWSPALQDRLLQQVGFGDRGLDVWLRDGFFEQHCKLFHQRPFIWHVWDGGRDGFSALVNYHKLDSALLDKLIYTCLGDWVRTQRTARDAGTPGADGRLVAALELQKKLEAIRDGEPPYDIYVRWKPIEKQPIGWDPDLNDGVRLNIRPFVEAGVLRNKVNGPRNKDRGQDPDGSERRNDRHFTVAKKLEARKVARV